MNLVIDKETLGKLRTKGTVVYLRSFDKPNIKYLPQEIIQSGLSVKNAIGYALAGVLYWDSEGFDKVEVNLEVYDE